MKDVTTTTEPEGWLLSPVAIHLVSWAKKQGVDVAGALRDVGLSFDDFAGQPRRVSIASMERLLAALGRRMPDDVFALRSGAATPHALIPLLGPLMTASSSLEEAFDALGRYYAVASDTFHVDVKRTGASLRVVSTWRLRTDAVRRYAAESTAAHWVAFAAAICVEAPRLVEVRFPFAAPSASAQRAHRDFFGVQPSYGPGRVLDLGWALGTDTRLSTQDATLVGLLREPLERERSGTGLGARVRRMLMAAPQPATLGAEALAAELGVSVRTLSRQLASEGTSFGALAREVLERRAKAQLSVAGRKVSEVALELGYASRSSFDRAFLRWTGRTPVRWRRETHPVGDGRD